MNTENHNNELMGDSSNASKTINDLIQELDMTKNENDMIKILLQFKDKTPEATLNEKTGMFLYFNYYGNAA